MKHDFRLGVFLIPRQTEVINLELMGLPTNLLGSSTSWIALYLK